MTKQRAKRMAPEERRQQIVDAAIELIVANGHSGCTLEQVAQHAAISKPLVYKYFPNREALLKAILEQEFGDLNGRGLDGIPKDVPIDRIILNTVERALHYYHERGPILRLLASDPDVARIAKASNQTSRNSTSKYFVQRFVEQFQVPEDVAIIAVTMVINAPIHSMTYLNRKQIDLDQTVKVWSTFIVGGWQALQAEYGGTRGGADLEP